jgi:hypothetical protein
LCFACSKIKERIPQMLFHKNRSIAVNTNFKAQITLIEKLIY